MAYGTRFTSDFKSPSGVGGVVTIYKKDYPGTPVNTLLLAGVEVEFAFKGWEDHIVGRVATLTFQNTNANTLSTALEQLMYAEEKEYKVEIKVTSTTPDVVVFEGFVNCEVTRQPYVGYNKLELTCSGYLSKLQYIYAPSIDTLQTMTFIDIVDEILQLTGTFDNIRVNSSLEETTYGKNVAGTQTMMNLYGFYTELFWKNNVDRKTALQILEEILSTFEAYLYWFDGYWYIERYEDLWKTTKNYIEYTVSTSYAPNATGTLAAETWVVGEVQDLVFRDLSQSIGMTPGKKQVNIALDEDKYFNLVRNDFSAATEISTVTLSTAPGHREWYFISLDAESSFSAAGEPYMDIFNGVIRTGLILGSYVDGGLMTTFKVKVQDNTSITIEWKYATQPAAVVGGMADPADTDVEFRWYLKTGGEFIRELADSAVDWEITDGATTYSSKENTINITGEDFDPQLWSYTCRVTIPLSEVNGLDNGTYDMQLIIGREAFTTSALGPECATIAVIGDVKVTVSAPDPDNYLEGAVVNDYLEELDVSMSLFDLADVNYKNTILCDTTLDKLSAMWTDGENTDTIARLKLLSKWRRYHTSQKVIGGQLHTGLLYKPFQMFTDSNDGNRKYIIAQCMSELHTDRRVVELYEYDNDETITLT